MDIKPPTSQNNMPPSPNKQASVAESLRKLAFDQNDIRPQGHFPLDPDPVWRGRVQQLGSHDDPEVARATAEAQLREMARENPVPEPTVNRGPVAGARWNLIVPSPLAGTGALHGAGPLAGLAPPGHPLPPPRTPKKSKKPEKNKKIPENVAENTGGNMDGSESESGVIQGQIQESLEAQEPRELNLQPLDPAFSGAGMRVVPARGPDFRLKRFASKEGCPPETTPLGYLLSMLGAECPETVNGQAVLMWEALRQKAAIALLPYMHPRIASVEVDEDESGHEAALDQLR